MISAKLIFTILGPLFLSLAAGRAIQARRLVPQAKAWLISGVMFSAVALWLWFH